MTRFDLFASRRWRLFLLPLLMALIPALPPGAGLAHAAESGTIRINEVESNNGSPGDWIELVNIGSTDVDLGGWQLGDDSKTWTIPAGTIVPAGGYRAFDESQFGFGLGSNDQARLLHNGNLEDSYSWTSHATTTYARCPNCTSPGGCERVR